MNKNPMVLVLLLLTFIFLSGCDELEKCRGDLSTCKTDVSQKRVEYDTCSQNYATCSGNLETCNNNAEKLQTNFINVSNQLNIAQNNLNICQGNLSICQSNLSDVTQERDALRGKIKITIYAFIVELILSIAFLFLGKWMDATNVKKWCALLCGIFLVIIAILLVVYLKF